MAVMKKDFMTPFRSIGDVFLIAVLLASLYLSFLVLRPFILVLFIGAVIVSVLYPLHLRVLTLLKGRESLAAFVSTFLVVAVLIFPLANFVILLSEQSLNTYAYVQKIYNDGAFQSLNGTYDIFSEVYATYAPLLKIEQFDLRKYFFDIIGKIHAFLISSTTDIIRGATNLVTDFLLIVLIMFFFFRDGKRLLEKLMFYTPLSNKYDHVLYKTFRAISVSTVGGTLVTALAQGITGTIGFYIAGIPGALFFGVAMAFLSMVPLVGPVLIWLPAALILIASGRIGAGIFLLFWGAIAISMLDNIIKPLFIKSGTHVNTLFVFFSILGGISLFGFWGIVFGPMILSITITLLHIYSLEYREILER